MVLALRQAGVESAQAQIAKGLAWLERNQETAGAWRATSMNKQRDPASDAGKFMSDAATAYSVFALSTR
jgi:squalene-hopene/tetraprenyl-beta-curcumene cyclase